MLFKNSGFIKNRVTNKVEPAKQNSKPFIEFLPTKILVETLLKNNILIRRT